ncbi:glycoside hydrolase superfamily [Mycena vulgaris]|nr:glycoside hydrolase superfamily [Mycena vulgaris]
MSLHSDSTSRWKITTSTAKANTVAKTLGGKLYFGSTKQNRPEGDIIAELAKKNGQLLRGFNGVSYNQLPSWVTAGLFGATTLQSILKTHVSTLMRTVIFARNSYLSSLLGAAVSSHPVQVHLLDGSQRPDAWDVVNGMYIYINENNIETAGAKSTAMINLVKSLKAAGTPIDGIGIQAHFVRAEVPSQADLIANCEAFTALGVEIAITELDSRTLGTDSGISLPQQKTDY